MSVRIAGVSPDCSFEEHYSDTDEGLASTDIVLSTQHEDDLDRKLRAFHDASQSTQEPP